jgi:small subunit ribosomal protein S20
VSIFSKFTWTKMTLSGKISLRYGSKLIGGVELANIKSAIKRNKQNQKTRLRNRVFRGRARTFVQKARQAIDTATPEDARTATVLAIQSLDKAAEKGIIHKNNAARRKSRLMKRLAAFSE